MTYWKASCTLLLTLAAVSALSRKCYETSRLPRRHVLKITELLRTAAEHSLRASQDSRPENVFHDTCQAKVNIDLVAQLLTREQVRHIANIDIDEIKEFIATQHLKATATLLAQQPTRLIVE
ncbi:unknown [Feldmannia species virus]|uniref:Uncharacterized protein n=1 Tax=Feldmannia species virus TaxID=39420 RepID=B5LWC8_9PHYC|nr:hypothetical protein FeldSpV_gp039 [Feldmannia species virus]ACH46791.1 unknown [Feldmannia species virus]